MWLSGKIHTQVLSSVPGVGKKDGRVNWECELMAFSAPLLLLVVMGARVTGPES